MALKIANTHPTIENLSKLRKKAARHPAGRLRVFRILYLSLLQRLYEHPSLLLPLDGEAVLEHVQGESVGAVTRAN